MGYIHKPKKLDKRYNGGGIFKYMVDVRRSIDPDYNFSANNRIKRLNEFVDMRIWAWDTWGPSCEIASYIPLEKDYVWSWDQEHSNMRVYLMSDKEMAWFVLRWS